MKNRSRTILSITGLALWIAFGVATTAQAQNREKYIISATAGGINYVSGNVTVERAGSQRHHALTSKDDLKSGDTVTTGAGGRVEVLLNPGSYMRVDENSEFVLEDASLDNLHVKLVKGSAIVEVTGADVTRMELEISTPQTEALIIRRGIYRFNILPNETTEIAVRKGRALYGKGLVNELRGGQKVLIERSRLEVAKLDKKNQDTLDLWSKERAETLARANRQLQSRALAAAFGEFNGRQVNGLIPSRYGSGVWVYNPRIGGFCFIPIGWSDWSSPYGYDYRTGFYYGGPDWTQRNGYPGQGGGATGSTGSGGNTGGGGYPGGSTNPTPAPAPPPTYQPPSPSPMQPIERAPSAPAERTPMREAPTRESTSPNK